MSIAIVMVIGAALCSLMSVVWSGSAVLGARDAPAGAMLILAMVCAAISIGFAFAAGYTVGVAP